MFKPLCAPGTVRHRHNAIRYAPLAIPFTLAAIVLGLTARQAQAVPAFAEQTGLTCQACHVGGFGPQLTPLGRDFKLNGYTMRSKAAIPVSAMAVGSFTHTRADQNPPPDGVHHTNDNFAFDQGSLFIAGGAGQHFGGFAQITYDGVAKSWSWDNLDLRAVTKGHLFGQDAVFGHKLFPGIESLLIERQFLFFIAFEHRHVEAVFGQFVHFGEQFPRPCQGVFFEIIAKRPVAQHFKHGVVVGINTHFFQIIVFSQFWLWMH